MRVLSENRGELLPAEPFVLMNETEAMADGRRVLDELIDAPRVNFTPAPHRIQPQEGR